MQLPQKEEERVDFYTLSSVGEFSGRVSAGVMSCMITYTIEIHQKTQKTIITALMHCTLSIMHASPPTHTVTYPSIHPSLPPSPEEAVETDSLSSSRRLCMCKGMGLDDTRTGEDERTGTNPAWSAECGCMRVLLPTLSFLLSRRTIFP